jgi:DNA-binding Lrp family transcriptional regulator
MLATETVRLNEYLFRHKGIREIIKQLDATNIKILSAMWKFGPRNLLEVSRQTGIPFTSVYHRVAKIESKSNRVASLIPQHSKLGLMRTVVLVHASPGAEERVSDALKLPNFWRSVNRCEGTFTHLSVQLIPVQFVKQFRTYLKQLVEAGLITEYKVIPTGQYVPNFPDFKYYNSVRNEWTFDWPGWSSALRNEPTRTIEDPKDYTIQASKKDILIVKELEKNARTSLADMGPLLGMSLQGVKYHFDNKLVPAGIVNQFAFDVWPYPEEVSAYHEIMLSFTSSEAMNGFFLGVSKVLNENALMVRTYILQNQVSNMFDFLSQLARDGILETYSSVRQDFSSREAQTISYELFDDEKGWTFDLDKCLSGLGKLPQLVTIQKT